MSAEALKGHLDLLLLSVLHDGPAHGYLIIERLRARSSGAFDLAEGTIYPALHRLERNALLESEWSEEKGRRRRIYRITADGVAALKALRVDYAAFSGGMRAVLGLS